MQINESNIPHYLLSNGYIDSKSLVDGDLVITENSSRNKNYKVTCGPGGFLLKQVRQHDADKIYSLSIEATCYWLANNEDKFTSLVPHMPVYLQYDTKNSILILELLPDATDVHQYYLQNRLFPADLAQKKAIALSACHSCGKHIAEQDERSLFRMQLPWIFDIDTKPLQHFQIKNRADIEILELVKGNAEFLSLINLMKSQWNKTCLIHGDVKWSNFLVQSNSGNIVLKLIDWEIADIGDPCWDIAGIIHSYLVLWVFSDFNPADMHASIRQFWDFYASEMKLSIDEKESMLTKSIQYAGIRTIQTCMESTYRSDSLHYKTAQALQLGLNILKYPKEIRKDLLGLN